MTTKEQEDLIKMFKVMVETYEALRKYKQMAFMVMPPEDQYKFIQAEQLYPAAKDFLNALEK